MVMMIKMVMMMLMMVMIVFHVFSNFSVSICKSLYSEAGYPDIKSYGDNVNGVDVDDDVDNDMFFFRI